MTSLVEVIGLVPVFGILMQPIYFEFEFEFDVIQFLFDSYLHD